MTSKRSLFRVVILALAVLGTITTSTTADARAEDNQFPTPELKAFHDAMHPLVHEAAPAKDAARIRAAAPDLDAKRSAVLRSGTGSATGKAKLELVKLLEAFNGSVTKLVQASKATGNDEAVLTALDDVHTAFGALVAGCPPK